MRYVSTGHSLGCAMSVPDTAKDALCQYPGHGLGCTMSVLRTRPRTGLRQHRTWPRTVPDTARRGVGGAYRE
eukprot:1095572-Rhodomonas_salina.1